MGYSVVVVTRADRLDDIENGVCAALARAGHRARALPYDGKLGRSLIESRPDVALVDDIDAWTEVADLLDMLGMAQCGPDRSARTLLEDAALVAQTLHMTRLYDASHADAPRTAVISRACFDQVGDACGAFWEDLADDAPACIRAGRAACPHEALRAEGASCVRDGVAELLRVADPVVVQEWVEGAEVAICVLGDENGADVLPAASPETDPGLAQAARYGELAWTIPARTGWLDLDPGVEQDARSEVERAALDAFVACGCSGAAVVRIVWDGGRAVVVGIDPAPSWMRDGLVWTGIDVAGLDHAEILDNLVCAAVERPRV